MSFYTLTPHNEGLSSLLLYLLYFLFPQCACRICAPSYAWHYVNWTRRVCGPPNPHCLSYCVKWSNQEILVPTPQVPIRLFPPVPKGAAYGPTASYGMVGLRVGPEVDFLLDCMSSHLCGVFFYMHPFLFSLYLISLRCEMSWTILAVRLGSAIATIGILSY